jgi:hypothetical protein
MVLDGPLVDRLVVTAKPCLIRSHEQDEPQCLYLDLLDAIDEQLKLVELVLRVDMIQALEQHQQ